MKKLLLYNKTWCRNPNVIWWMPLKLAFIKVKNFEYNSKNILLWFDQIFYNYRVSWKIIKNQHQKNLSSISSWNTFQTEWFKKIVCSINIIWFNLSRSIFLGIKVTTPGTQKQCAEEMHYLIKSF